ncbi:MAG: sulfatase-like hydrolase/transferase [Nannocystis sp.]|nr:sulfatase-like hydrolase/transferase [Nannocystis sp.]
MRRQRRRWWLGLVWAISSGCGDDGGEEASAGEEAGEVGEVEAPDERLNVVLVVLESIRWDAATPYSPALPTTPFLERFAADNVRVETIYTVVPHTTKALVPIHCGRYPAISKAIVETAPGALGRGCLAARLAAAGYATFFIQPAREGFENRSGLVANFGFKEFAGKESLPSAGFDESSYFGFEDDIMLGPALAWVDAQEGPFFLAVLTLTAHHDYTPPAGFATQHFVDDPVQNDYLNAVAYTDRFVEKLHLGLDARGLLEETIVVVVGDHGEAFGEHGRFQHDNVIWEEGLRVPLVIGGPGVGPPGRVIEGLFQTIDVAPTLATLLGLTPTAEDALGVDLLRSDGHERLFFSCWADERCLAMREGARKAIHHFGALPDEVFDLVADPSEKSNVIAVGDNQAFASSAIAAMFAWAMMTLF